MPGPVLNLGPKGFRRQGRAAAGGRHSGEVGQDEEGRFAANAILFVIGIGLVCTGIGLLGTSSARLPKLQTFNDAADAWDQGLRAKFKATSFALHFVHCATCDPELTVDFHADETGHDDSFSRPEEIRHRSAAKGGKAAEEDRHGYVPLRYTSNKAVEAMDVLDLIEGNDIKKPIELVLEARPEGGKPQRLAVTEPLLLYTMEPGAGNSKVCRNAHGEWVNGECQFRWFLRSMCFTVVDVDGAWTWDPETPGLGCDVYDDWDYAQYQRDTRSDDRLEQGDFSFFIQIRHGDDPFIIARDATSREHPDFGEGQGDMRAEGTLTICLGLLLLCAPAFQVFFHYRDAMDRRRAAGQTSDVEAQGLLQLAREEKWLGEIPSVPNPFGGKALL